MIDFFTKIFNYISLGFQIILNNLQGLFYFFQALIKAPAFLLYAQAFIPTFLVGFFAVGLAVKVVMRIIGR